MVQRLNGSLRGYGTWVRIVWPSHKLEREITVDKLNANTNADHKLHNFTNYNKGLVMGWCEKGGNGCIDLDRAQTQRR